MKHKWLWLCIAILLAVGSIFAVFQQSKQLSPAAMIEEISQANPLWILAAIVCVFGFIFFEGESICVVLRALGYKGKSSNAANGIVYSSGDIYFSSITPSASGGQPASLYFMIKQGIPGSIATVALIVTLMMYTISILVILLISLILRPKMLFSMSALSVVFIVVGAVLLLGLTGIILLFIRSRSAAQKLLQFVAGILHKIHLVKDPERMVTRFSKTLDSYNSAAKAVSAHKGVLLRCFLCNFLQRALQIAVSAMMYLALADGPPAGAVDIWTAQAYVTVGYTCVPVPGAMGVADYMMLDAFSQIIPGDAAIKLELLSRSISFYLCVVFCGIVIATAYMRGRKNQANLDHRKEN